MSSPLHFVALSLTLLDDDGREVAVLRIGPRDRGAQIVIQADANGSAFINLTSNPDEGAAGCLLEVIDSSPGPSASILLHDKSAALALSLREGAIERVTRPGSIDP